MGLGGATNTAWNGQCDPYALHSTPPTPQPVGITGSNGATTQCTGDLQVINGEYPAWRYVFLDLNSAAIAHGNNPEAQAFLGFIANDPEERLVAQQYGLLSACQMT